MKRLLVTGGSGFLGWNICQRAKSDWSVFGTYFTHPVGVTGVKAVRADLTIFDDIKMVFTTVKPAAVIHTAAVSDPNFCQENRKTSYKLNTEAAINIAGLCSDRKIPCLFTSTDLVFDGISPPYKEEDEPSPVNVYGEQKVMAEDGMQSRNPATVICRMPLMFGNPGPSATNSTRTLLKQMKLGIEVNLFVDEYRTPLSGKNAAEGLMLALAKLPDIIHLGGLEPISRYEFGKLVARIFNISNAKLIPCNQQDMKMAAARPSDVSLDCTKAKKLGFMPDTIEAALQDLKCAMDI